MTTTVTMPDGRRFHSITEAAKRLGVDTTTIHYHINKYGNVDRIGKRLGTPIEIDGVTYPSIRAASVATGKSIDVLQRMRGYRKPDGSQKTRKGDRLTEYMQIAAAMIHKTRGPFIEWMAHEIAARMKNSDVRSVGVSLSDMAAHGLVSGPHKLPACGASWKLTDKGAALAAKKNEVAFTTRRVVK